MSVNAYYNPSGSPATSSEVTSAVIRAEFVAIAAGFALLPALPLTANTAVVVNSAGTGFAITGGLSIAGSFATTGAFTTTLAQVASVVLTLPAVNGTLATLAGNETLFNKTLVTPALGVPSSGDLSNCTGTAPGLTAGNVQTLPNLTGPITSSGTVTSIAAQTGTGSVIVVQTSPTLITPVLGVASVTTLNGLAITATSAAHLNIASSKTLTASNSLTLAGTDGTTMTFPGTSDTVVTLAATQSLSNKSLVAPALGTVASGNIAACTGFPTATNGQTFLGSDVALNNTGTVFDVVNTGSIGANGWVVEIEICGSFINTASAGVFDYGIFNGASYIIADRTTTSGINLRTTGTLSIIVTLSAATTFTFRAQDVTVTTSVVATSGGSPFSLANKATYIKWTRLA